MIELIRTNSENPDFQNLVRFLDAELKIRDGEDHSFYAQFNKIDSLSEVVVAYLNEIAVGCGAIKAYSKQTAEVKRMFVKPENRGRGIAGKILAELETRARELGFAECILETGLKQPEAIALYKKSGYETIPNYGQYADVENSVCMKKAIKSEKVKNQYSD
jgi:GNAT superfamily N-acetyltransferase